jgi:hypothetical protein
MNFLEDSYIGYIVEQQYYLLIAPGLKDGCFEIQNNI